MALKTSGSPTPNNGGTSQPTAMAGAFEQAGHSRRGNDERRDNDLLGGMAWSRMGSDALSSGMSSTMESEQLSKFAETFRDCMSMLAETLSYKLILIDKESDVSRLAASQILLAVWLKEKKNEVVYFSNILARPAGDFEPIQESWGNQTIEIPRFTPDAYTPEMAEVIRERLVESFGEVDFLNAQGQVIPTYIKLDDKKQVYSIATNAVRACVSQINMLQPGFTDVSLSTFTKYARAQSREDRERLECKIDFGCEPTPDAAGFPVRRTIQIRVQVVQPRRRGNDLTGSRSDLCTISAYVDLLSTGNPGRSRYRRNDRPEDTQMFQPVIVITDIVNHRLNTPAGTALALQQIFALPETGAWINALDPNGRGAVPLDMRDIGNLGWELDLEGDGKGRYIPTNTPEFQDRGALMDFMNAFIIPDPIFAIDVQALSGNYWSTNVFSAAADGNKHAYEDIIDGFDKLFDGEFRRVLGKDPMFMGNSMMMHAGYYENADGKLCPLTDADYLAAAAHNGATDREALDRWNWSFASNDPQERRLQVRGELIRQILGSRVTFTGWTHRCFLSNHLLNAMVECSANAGYTVQLSYQQDRAEYQDRFSRDWLAGGYADRSRLDHSGLFSRANNRQWARESGANYLGQIAGWRGRGY